jgi:hypothetical protein
MQEKYKQGPVGMMTVFPSGLPAMPKFMGMWFVYCLVISFFTAYLTGHTVAPGVNYRSCFVWRAPRHLWPMGWDSSATVSGRVSPGA